MRAEAKREGKEKNKSWWTNWKQYVWTLYFLPLAMILFGSDYMSLIDVRFNDREHLEWKIPVRVSWPNAIATNEDGEIFYLDGGADLYKIQTDGSKVKLHDTRQSRYKYTEFPPNGIFLTSKNNIVLVTKDSKPLDQQPRVDRVPIPTIFNTMDHDGSVIAKFTLPNMHNAIDVDKLSEIIYAMDGDFRLSAFAVNGELLWAHALDSNPNRDTRRFKTYWIEGKEGGGVLAVSHGGTLVSLSSSGDILWENSEHVICGRDIAIAPDGTIVAGVDLRGLVAINPDGTTQWFNPKAMSWNDGSGSMVVSTDGTILMSNYTTWLIALDSDGIEIWRKELGSLVLDIAANDANSFYVTTEYDGLFCFDAQGAELWANPGIDYVFGDIVVNPNGLIHFATYNRLYALEP